MIISDVRSSIARSKFLGEFIFEYLRTEFSRWYLIKSQSILAETGGEWPIEYGTSSNTGKWSNDSSDTVHGSFSSLTFLVIKMSRMSEVKFGLLES